MLIETIVESFFLFPVGPVTIPENLPMQTVLWIGETFKGALLIAMPAMASILLINLAFGVVTRAAPQLNIFAVGFPVTISGGFHDDDAQPPRLFATVFRLDRARICSDAGALWVIYG